MASKDKSPLDSKGIDEQKSLKEHAAEPRLEAHKENRRLAAHTDKDDAVPVPAVTADVDETPKFVQYGAAILLGLAFGVGCYIWVDGGIPSAPQNPGRVLRLPTAAGYTSADYADNLIDNEALPSPFDNSQEIIITSGAEDYYATAAVTLGADATLPDNVVYLFGYDSSTVPETASLTAIARKATANGLTLDVKAYTDEHGRYAYNQRLSERRAKAVGDYLITHGVPAKNVKIKGMGPTHAYGDDAHDRRAEVTVSRR